MEKERHHSYLKVCINVSRDDELRLGLVLTVNDVHLELLLVFLEQVSEIHRILNALFEILGEVTKTRDLMSSGVQFISP